jgi:hypothetical protein
MAAARLLPRAEAALRHELQRLADAADTALRQELQRGSHKRQRSSWSGCQVL